MVLCLCVLVVVSTQFEEVCYWYYEVELKTNEQSRSLSRIM